MANYCCFLCCRACGRLLCNTCCGHTYPLQYLRWAPARVCLTCKERLDGPRWPPRRSRSLNSMADETIARLVREMQVESSKRRSLSLPHHHHHRGEDPAASLIGLLPPEVLSKIFDLLGHSDKLACRAVCHHWLQVPARIRNIFWFIRWKFHVFFINVEKLEKYLI